MHPTNLVEDRARQVVIDYTNHESVRRERTIIPHQISFNRTPYHPDPQWIMEATDVERNVVRRFAMKDVHSWRAVS